jgi:hypothetical protein
MDQSAPYRPKLGFDIRIRPPREERVVAHVRACEWPGCEGAGEHKAPRSREELEIHTWYCLDHVREFNRQWDFFAGRTDDEVRAFQASAVFGHRPTWRFGTISSVAGVALNERRRRFGFPGFDDPLGVFERARASEPAPRPGLTKRQAKALDVFNLTQTAGRDEIRRRYTQLVKRFHPDANGGDRGREERLREVIDAYQVLKRAGLC